MGITGLIPFIEKASRRANVSEFSGCTVAIDSYCWLHKGAFACADKLSYKILYEICDDAVIKQYKPILVFDGRHLPAKAMTEAKRRESRDISKKRAAELLTLGKTEEARSYMRRSVDITHAMALSLIKECRSRNVDCLVAPYEADAQLAYLNIKNIAHLVITEDSDLVLFGCTKVLFKMDLEGTGTLVETIKLPLVMKCPIERYTFDKFRQMCIMSGCDYLPSLPGIGLAKARQFVIATQDINFANALKKLPAFFNKSTLKVTDEYRENFLKAEATFKHQYVYDPIERKMVRLTDPDDEDIEEALCVNAGELLDEAIAFQLALGNLDPFTLKKMDDWHPDYRPTQNINIITDNSKKDKSILATHTSIWSVDFKLHLDECCPWQRKVKKPEPITAITQTRPRKKVAVNLITKYVPETQDESLSIETLSDMYRIEPVNKKQKTDCDDLNNHQTETLTQYTQSDYKNDVAFADEEVETEESIETLTAQKDKSPILENKLRSYKKSLNTKYCGKSYSVMKRLSRFPRTVLEENDVVESKFFINSCGGGGGGDGDDKDSGLSSLNESQNSVIVEEETPSERNYNPFKKKSTDSQKKSNDGNRRQESARENSRDDKRSPSPILGLIPGGSESQREYDVNTEDSVIESTNPYERLVTPVDSQSSFGVSSLKEEKSDCNINQSQSSQRNCFNQISNIVNKNGFKKSNCRVFGLKKTTTLPSNQPTLLNKFGFQKKPVLKRC